MAVSRSINAAFIFTNFLYLCAGIVLIVFSVMWRSSQNDTSTVTKLLTNMVITPQITLQGLICGGLNLFAWLLTSVAFVRRFKNSLFNPSLWAITIATLALLICGSIVWFTTLVERAHFGNEWQVLPIATQARIQDALTCCGYWNSTVFPGNAITPSLFCPTPGSGNSTGANVIGCVGPITSFADGILNPVFTVFYTVIGLALGLFLATVCVLNARGEDERYRRIDEKRGGNRSFV